MLRARKAQIMTIKFGEHLNLNAEIKKIVALQMLSCILDIIHF